MPASGLKLLVRAKPAFNAQSGLPLEVDAMDPAYTLGDLEVKIATSTPAAATIQIELGDAGQTSELAPAHVV